MSTRTIRSAQFMFYVPTGRTRTRRDGATEDILSVRHALRGDTVDIPRDEDIARGERNGSFVVPKVEEESAVEEEAALDFSSHDTLMAWFEAEKPSVATVVAAADNDADKAEMLLEAENTATGGQSRKGVVTGLNRIIDEAEDED